MLLNTFSPFFPFDFNFFFTCVAGEITPLTDAEMIIAISVMFLGMFMLPAIIGNLTSAAENLDPIAVAFQERLTIVKQYLQLKKTSTELQVNLFFFFLPFLPYMFHDFKIFSLFFFFILCSPES